MNEGFQRFFLIFLLLCHSVVFSREVSEQDIKAVYLYNFVQFISWPVYSRDHPGVNSLDDSIRICVVGQEPYINAFKEVEGKQLRSDNRFLFIDHYTDFSQIKQMNHCQILFMTASERDTYSKVIRSLETIRPFLIGETQGFLKAGG